MYGSLMLISAVLIGALGNDVQKSVSYTVDQVIEVQQSGIITCRLRDYFCPTPVRFQIRLLNVEALREDPNGLAAQRYLYERLSNARQVRLTSVQDRGYFQLTASVLADGRDIGAEMVEYGLLRSSSESLSSSTESKDTLPGAVLWDSQPVVQTAVVSQPLSVAIRTQAIEKYLACEADLSRIGPDTTFEEALSLLAEANQPRLPILILWNDLHRNAFIERDTPIGIEGFGQMRLDKALDLILRSVSMPPAKPVTAVVEGGVMTIATDFGVGQKARNQVYSIADILSAPSEDQEQQMGSGSRTSR